MSAEQKNTGLLDYLSSVFAKGKPSQRMECCDAATSDKNAVVDLPTELAEKIRASRTLER